MGARQLQERTRSQACRSRDETWTKSLACTSRALVCACLHRLQEHTEHVAETKVLSGVEQELHSVLRELEGTRGSVRAVVAQLDAALAGMMPGGGAGGAGGAGKWGRDQALVLLQCA